MLIVRGSYYTTPPLPPPHFASLTPRSGPPPPPPLPLHSTVHPYALQCPAGCCCGHRPSLALKTNHSRSIRPPAFLSHSLIRNCRYESVKARRYHTEVEGGKSLSNLIRTRRVWAVSAQFPRSSPWQPHCWTAVLPATVP